LGDQKFRPINRPPTKATALVFGRNSLRDKYWREANSMSHLFNSNRPTSRPPTTADFYNGQFGINIFK
jgi:hypothetical protein